VTPFHGRTTSTRCAALRNVPAIAALVLPAGLLTASSAEAATGAITGPAGTCPDVADNSSANGARAQIRSCTGAANPKWTAPTEQTGDQCWATHYDPQPPGALPAGDELLDKTADAAGTSLSRRPQLPFRTRIQVTNVANGRSLVMRINDRGTFTWTVLN
jgi:rare lipoprotein A (peptidoglycan hydrolase)